MPLKKTISFCSPQLLPYPCMEYKWIALSNHICLYFSFSKNAMETSWTTPTNHGPTGNLSKVPRTIMKEQNNFHNIVISVLWLKYLVFKTTATLNNSSNHLIFYAADAAEEHQNLEPAIKNPLIPLIDAPQEYLITTYMKVENVPRHLCMIAIKWLRITNFSKSGYLTNL